MKEIEYITEESGNWCVLVVPRTGKMKTDFRYEGHSIPEQIWLDIFKKIGYQVSQRCISDECMENENY